MSVNKSPEWHHQNTDLIIEELIADGSDPDALYIIEHHCCSNNFAALEKFCIDAFKLGYEIEDPEEFLTEKEETAFSCDLISELPLKSELINAQITQLIQLCNKNHIHYDGWGTYFESGEDDEETTIEIDDNNYPQPTLH